MDVKRFILKPMNVFELESMQVHINEEFEGAQLQEVFAYENALVLGFYRQQIKYLVIDLTTIRPFMLIMLHNPWGKTIKKKPVGLFIHAHIVGLRFLEMTRDENLGRVVKISFAASRAAPIAAEMEIHLIPHQPNLFVRANDKSISWNKPKELSPSPEPTEMEARSLRTLQDEWMAVALVTKQTPGVQQDWQQKKEKALQKKRKALQEIEKKMQEDPAQSWYELGELLKVQNLNDLTSEWDPFLDRKRSLAWNRENAFAKAKQAINKKQGTLKRIELLKDEIANLEAQSEPTLVVPRSGRLNISKDGDTKARQLQLDSGAWAYVGKSAQDNLKILRRAKAWDLWLHLKDYPGSHGIIHREKNQKINDAELDSVALWVAKESLSKKSVMPGLKLAYVFTECRHVHPIKGDKLGRVNYHHAQERLVVLK